MNHDARKTTYRKSGSKMPAYSRPRIRQFLTHATFQLGYAPLNLQARLQVFLLHYANLLCESLLCASLLCASLSYVHLLFVNSQRLILDCLILRFVDLHYLNFVALNFVALAFLLSCES